VKLDLFGKKSEIDEHAITVKEQTSKKQTQLKKKKSSTDFAYSYSIIPTNFINLSEESQIQRLGQFFDILNVIDDRIKITMSRRIIPITVEGQIQNMPVMQVRNHMFHWPTPWSKTDWNISQVSSHLNSG
jgi:hypothetical protein